MLMDKIIRPSPSNKKKKVNIMFTVIIKKCFQPGSPSFIQLQGGFNSDQIEAFGNETSLFFLRTSYFHLKSSPIR